MTRLLVAAFVALSLAACSASSGTGTDDDTSVPDAMTDSGDASSDAAVCEDPDRDGFGPNCAAGEDDCQPTDPGSFPGADERCGDLVDNDCDGAVDEECPCIEGQTEFCYTGPEGTADVGVCSSGYRVCEDGVWTECTDEVTPRAAEESACNGADDDCDGEVDEGLTNACGDCGAEALEVCGDGIDNNCDGVIDEAAAGCDCDDRTRQPCYSGRPQTLGVGRCRGGLMDCDGDAWGACIGELLPIAEVCDGEDNDCDGSVDEGLRNACGVCGAPEPAELCDGLDNDCDGDIDEGLRLACGLCPGEEAEEECGDGLDNDCDGQVDEQCACVGDPACYPGPAASAGVGQCAAGTRTCDASGEFWTTCVDFVLPTVEICDGVDNDCNGSVDINAAGCSVCGSSPEICDDVDNDCDGAVDEGVRNTCGDCIDEVVPEALCDGEDEDCDGFVDEGLTNACGTCDESCYTRDWDDPADWETGEFDGIDEGVLDEGLRLGTSRATFPDLWVANTDDNTVTRINTDDATAVATFPVGSLPSRTAVDFDGNVYVANRAFDEVGSVTRILANDCEGEACIAWTTNVGDSNDIPRGLAVDREGYAWVGTYHGRQLFRLAPDTGEIVETFDIPVQVYGLAIDSEGIIWIATIAAIGVGAFDSNTHEYLGAWALEDCSTPYGIAVDNAGNVWAGGWRCDGLIRLDRSAFDPDAPPEERVVEMDHFDHPNMLSTRGVAVDGEGMVYVAASETNRVGKFNPVTEEWEWTVETCNVPIGIGVASDANIWVMCKNSSEAVRYDPDGNELDVVTTGRGPYSYSDMTGFQLRNFTAPSGTWRVEFDCGYEICGFDAIDFEAALPPGTRVRVRARSRAADSASDAWGAWTPQFDVSPAPIQGLLPDGRFVQVEVELATSDRAVTPVVTSLSVDWQRP